MPVYSINPPAISPRDSVSSSTPELKYFTKIPQEISNIKTADEFIAVLRNQPCPIDKEAALEFKKAYTAILESKRGEHENAGGKMSEDAFSSKDYNMADYNKVLELKSLAYSHGVFSGTPGVHPKETLVKGDFGGLLNLLCVNVAISNVADKMASSPNPLGRSSFGEIYEDLKKEYNNPVVEEKEAFKETKAFKKIVAETARLLSADK